MGAKRTPFGTFGGVFRNTSATELQTYAFNAALKEANVAATQVDTVVVGQVMSVSTVVVYRINIFQVRQDLCSIRASKYR